MKTRVLTVDPAHGPWPEMAELAAMVADGGLVAFPTETVYGIAVNARDEAAMRRLAQAKGRSESKPLTEHLADPRDLNARVQRLPHPARKLALRFWPGPLTLVVPDRHKRPTGFRVPDVPVTREFLRMTGCRVAASSANLAGDPDATTADEVLEHFDGLVDGLVDGGPCRHKRPSTVVRVLDGQVEILREGAIPADLVRETTARLLLFVCAGDRTRGPIAAALAARLLARRLGTEPDQLLESGYRVESAGSACLRPTPAAPQAEAVARDYGVDLLAHRSRALTPSLVEDADEIYVMCAGQKASILEFDPEAVERIRMLDRTGADVPDPAGSGPRTYRAVAQRIHRALQGRLDDF